MTGTTTESRLATLGTSLRVATLLAVTAAPLAAQTQTVQMGWGSESGNLSPDVRFSMVTRSEGREPERRWPTAVILWRVPEEHPLQQVADPAAMRAADEAYRRASRAAEDRNRAFLGFRSNDAVGVAEYDRDAGLLFVHGRTFTAPDRDSVLVVMVDRVARPSSEFGVVGSAYVAGNLPPEAWGKSWRSGDTVFHVFPRRRHEHLRELLRRSPAVRSFLDAARPPLPDDPQSAIRAVQRRRFEAMVTRDLRALDTLLTHDLTYTHTTGTVDTKASLLDDLRTGRLVYDSIVPSDVRVRLYGSTAAVTGLARMQVRVAGGPILRFGVRFTEVYVDNGGRWQLAVWQSTRLPER